MPARTGRVLTPGKKLIDIITRCVVGKAFRPRPLPRRISVMAEATARTARISLKDVRASVKRMQTEGERLVGRIRRDAQTLISRTRREAVTDLLGDARKFEQAIRKRAEKTIQDIEGRRARIIASLEEQATRLVETVVKRLNLVTEDEVKDLRKRIAHLERRLDQLAAGKEKAA